MSEDVRVTIYAQVNNGVLRQLGTCLTDTRGWAHSETSNLLRRVADSVSEAQWFHEQGAKP